MAEVKITDLDLYDILGLEITATTSDIRKAYKKKALKCHPDKNPDNPKAAQLFHQLTQALEILLDERARSSYDKLLKAKEAAKLRHKALDSKRKKFKEDLEERERAAASGSTSHVSEEDKLRTDIDRIRKEGVQLLQDEIKLLQEEMLKESESMQVPEKDQSLCQLKVSWSTEKDGAQRYTEKTLNTIFSKYGQVTGIAASNKKAIVEFENPDAASLAVRIEIGFVENPLKVTYAHSKQQKVHVERLTRSETMDERTQRQAAERRRIIEEMMKADLET